jgi:hypothetical protein
MRCGRVDNFCRKYLATFLLSIFGESSMKRLQEIVVNGIRTGTYNYSNGMVGTRDLPEFVAETAYFRAKGNSKHRMMMRNIKAPTDTRKTWREQLSAVIKACNKKFVAA